MDEVNACIAANAEQEELVDQPEMVKGITRVSGPFTVEAVLPKEADMGRRARSAVNQRSTDQSFPTQARWQ